jgi:hypothetical protein
MFGSDVSKKVLSGSESKLGAQIAGGSILIFALFV